MEHALRDCRWIRNFWSSSSIQGKMGDMPAVDTTLGDWITSVSRTLPTAKHCVFISLLWGAWFARNKLYFEDQTLDMGFIQSMSCCLVDEFKRANTCVNNRVRAADIPAQIVWKPPDVGFIKINIDASVISGLENGIGGVARDAHGVAMWCFAETVKGVLEVETAEALAALRACKLAVELHAQHVILETDSQILYNALKYHKPNISFFGMVVRDILALCPFFEMVRFNWVRRVDNSVAHRLASLARSIDVPLFSHTLPPSCMNEFFADLQNY
ncbi:hypothetical protein ACS0TY_005604 [Phlomoides rotata]